MAFTTKQLNFARIDCYAPTTVCFDLNCKQGKARGKGGGNEESIDSAFYMTAWVYL